MSSEAYFFDLVCPESLPGEEPGEWVTSSVEDSEWSCLGIRQRCLRDVPRCSRPLADYRLHCRENRKRDQCIPSDWYTLLKIRSNVFF